ncbi:DUF6167 family protein [Streptomyces gobiensis]|uniref:DUF6167 family protein n=1 Tax=Streptomyces gobiensis TaxID=2875706 RepID=UPI001E449887|nr:DUF6167 family protein [Streptomyces gobiensis]UGY90386.1 DUF6167 family protein [Streptomyces gobiensis]
MFRRAFWFSAGAAAGVWATTKVNRKLRSLTPESLAARAAGKAVDTGHRLKEFALDVRAGMTQRESELNEALGLTADPDHPAPVRQLPGQARRAQLGPINRTTGKEDH